jgi:hypothetical protein
MSDSMRTIQKTRPLFYILRRFKMLDLEIFEADRKQLYIDLQKQITNLQDYLYNEHPALQGKSLY